ncbi:MAG: pinensin family lanthipeptide [Cyclobacteriaceae bacterium]
MKKKLKTSDLKVQSFVTDLTDRKSKTVRGGLPQFSINNYNCGEEPIEEHSIGTCDGSFCNAYCSAAEPYVCNTGSFCI